MNSSNDCDEQHDEHHHSIVKKKEHKNSNGIEINKIVWDKIYNRTPEGREAFIVSILGRTQVGKSFLVQNLIGNSNATCFPEVGEDEPTNCKAKTQTITYWDTTLNGYAITLLDHEGSNSAQNTNDPDYKVLILVVCCLLLAFVIDVCYCRK